MSEYGAGRYEVGREEADTIGEPLSAEGPHSVGDLSTEGELVSERELVSEPVEEPVEEYADPQEWISGLISAVERAEQGIGSGPRDALMARIKLAQAYSELGDTVQAAPLAVANVTQAERLFPSSEGMLRQLREFRDAACEAAGWTAAMMRESEPDPEPELEVEPEAELGPEQEPELAQGQEPGEAAGSAEASESSKSLQTSAASEPAKVEPFGHPSELVSRAAAVAAAAETNESAKPYDPAEDFSTERPAHSPTPAPGSTPAAGSTLAAGFAAAEPEPAAAVAEGHQIADPEPAGAVIHEFVRRTQEPDALQWAAEVQAALTQPAELAIPTPPEPEYAEEVEPALASADLADLSDLADLAAIEEIIRLRYELREAQRTIERLRHVNRKLREALEFDQGS